jgi:hypothetical protein
MMKFRPFASYVMLGLGILTSSPALAFTCRASPAAYLAVDAGGNVHVSMQDAGITAVCNLSSNVSGVSPQACAAWYSAFLTFKTTGKTVLLHYSGSDGATGCSSYHSWEAHFPYFVLFE